MAKVIPTVAQIRATSFSGEFDAVPDASIEMVRDNEVVDLYCASDLTAHTQWAAAVALHTAHILHVMLKLDEAGGDWGALGAVTSRTLQGVGTRARAAGALNPGDAIDIMRIPSRYLARLTRILATFPPSVHTTGGSANGAQLAAAWGVAGLC